MPIRASERDNTSEAVLPKVIDFGREICGDLAAAESREWLVTNGIGGFACGTIAGTLTRRYHSLLMAALRPPLERTLLVAKFDEFVDYACQSYALGANRWGSGMIYPHGYIYLERFHLEAAMPVWTYAFADALLEKRLWMAHGANTTYVEYRLVRGTGPLRLTAKALVNYRDYHWLTRTDSWQMDVQPAPGGIRVQAFAEARPFYLLSAEAQVEPFNIWYKNFDLPVEKSRGLDHQEDHLHAATFMAELKTGDAVTLIASTEADATADGQLALLNEGARAMQLVRACARTHTNWSEWPRWIKYLVLAADQFIVQRCGDDTASGQPVSSQGRDNSNPGFTIIAGYPWFTDWGRDTMIALPGLLMATGRAEIAANVLRTFARYVKHGMIPNCFPDVGTKPEYNTVDAALWFIAAIRQHHATTKDLSLVRELYPVIAEIIHAYTQGTLYNIHVDSQDGLLYAGEPGAQLTWMDAKVGDWVVTPRIGKPIEINALWLAALDTFVNFSKSLGESAETCVELATKARQNFQQFWNADTNCCFDVIGGPGGNDPSERPNQIFAVALEESPLTTAQQRAVLETCSRQLLTSFGLRSLTPQSPNYRGRYGGDPKERDSAYHQGIVWGWLIGPFIEACLRVTGDAEQALSFLGPFENHLKIHGLGTASEIFDAEPPFAPQGCFAQAWTVAELIRAWVVIGRARQGRSAVK